MDLIYFNRKRINNNSILNFNFYFNTILAIVFLFLFLIIIVISSKKKKKSTNLKKDNNHIIKNKLKYILNSTINQLKKNS